MSEKETSEYYEEAIAHLQAYAFGEPDKAKQAEAWAAVRRYEYAIQDKAFNNIIYRTPKLEALVRELQDVIKSASNATTVMSSIGKLQELAGDVVKIIKPNGSG